MKNLLYLFLCLVLFNCKSIDTGNNNRGVSLYGIVYNSENLSVSEARLLLDGEFPAMTDINGRFLFENIPVGTHTLTIEKKRYEDMNLEFNLLNYGQMLYITLVSFKDVAGILEMSFETSDPGEIPILLERLKKIDLQDITYKYLRIVYLSELSKYEEALKELEHLEREYPDNINLFLTRANILFYGLNKKSEVLELITNSPWLVDNLEFKKFSNRITAEFALSDADEGGGE